MNTEIMNTPGQEHEIPHQQLLHCRHCHTPLPARSHSDQKILQAIDKGFCCPGCETVFGFLHEHHLDDFYGLRSEEDTRKAAPAQAVSSRFQYFDDPVFASDHVTEIDAETSSITFYTEGLHCAACIWLLEKLPHLVEGVLACRVNFSNAHLTIRFLKSTKLSLIAKTIASLGYTPRPLQDEDGLERYQKESLQLIYRMGVAAVAAGNCMMIAVSLYEGGASGIEKRYEHFFIWLSALLSLPVIVYSSQPFYRAALNGLRSGRTHVDLPISIGILLGYMLSCISAIQGRDAIYFDSLSILVFFMLAARVVQRYTLKTVTDMRTNLKGLLPDLALRVTNMSSLHNEESPATEEVYIGSLQPGDQVFIRTNERIPTDGVLESGEGLIDNSILTGESQPIPVANGEHLFAGALNVGKPFVLRSTRAVKNSRIQSYFDQSKIQTANRDRVSSSRLIETLSAYFVIFVLVVASGTFAYWLTTDSLQAASEATLAFLIVTCPCALGLSSPLILAKAITDGVRHGIFIAEPNSFEWAAKARLLFLDKTGTLTDSSRLVLSSRKWVGDSWVAANLTEKEQRYLLELEKDSHHPVAQALRRTLRAESSSEATLFQLIEQSRTGVRGVFQNGSAALVGNREFLKAQLAADNALPLAALDESENAFFFFFENTLYGFTTHEVLDECAHTFLRWAKEKSREVIILSGDHERAVSTVAAELGLPPDQAFGGLTPEEKASIIETHRKTSPSQKTIMVGDGANDAPAFKAATVGIGLRGGAEQLLTVSDVYIQSGKLNDLLIFIKGSIRTISMLRLSYGLSIGYNVVVGFSAACGFINPLLAAILMPISSFTVIGLAIFAKPFHQSLK